MRYLFLLVITLWITLVFYACGPDKIIENERTFSERGWSQDQELTTTFSIADTNQLYNLVLEVKHSADYGFQNLYTQLVTQFPDGKTLKKAVSLELANKSGQWYGNCGGGSCTLQIPIQQGAFFNLPGNYTITVQPFMRMDPIPGVEALYFWVEETEGRR